jgi:peroxiredoxin
MKSIVFFLFGMMAWANITFAQSPAPKLFKVTGSIKGNTQISKINVVYDNKGLIVVPVKNGQYNISGSITEPTIMHLTSIDKEGGSDLESRYDLYLISGNVVLQSDKTLSNSNVSGAGAKWDKDYQYFTKQIRLKDELKMSLINETMNLYSSQLAFKKGKSPSYYGRKEYQKDSIRYLEVQPLSIKNQDSILARDILLPYIKKNPESPVGLWALINIGGVGKDKNEIVNYASQNLCFEQLSPSVRALSFAKMFKEKLDLKGGLQLGKPAPDFNLPDTLGQRISLSSLRGKYVLVDFWASWCVPCRAEVPHFRSAYNKYKSKGFTILGVSALTPMNSIDVTNWKKAIVEDQSHWLHVFDEKKEVGKRYGINSIPFNFLVDPNGVIIAINVMGINLEKKLKELLGE